MRLWNLPLDVMRPILGFLPIDAIVRLYATEHRLLQKLIAAPGALANSSIPADYRPQDYDYTAFLRAIRTIGHLEGRLNNIEIFELLPILNPASLEIYADIKDKTIVENLKNFATSPQDATFQHKVRTLCWDGSPNLALLTRRLSHLHMYRSLRVPSDIVNLENLPPTVLEMLPRTIVFPPTLTHLELSSTEDFVYAADYDILPTTLLHFVIHYEPMRNVKLGLIMDHLFALQTLDIKASSIDMTPTSSETSPPTGRLMGQAASNLQSFKLSTVSLNIDDLPLLLSKHQQLMHFELVLRETSSWMVATSFTNLIDLSVILPPSLQSLSIHLHCRNTLAMQNCGLKGIPARLTCLTLVLHHEIGIDFFASLALMSHLEELNITLNHSTSDINAIIKQTSAKALMKHAGVSNNGSSNLPPSLADECFLCGFIPSKIALRNLKKLRLDGVAMPEFSKEDIDVLPKSLRLFKVANIALDVIPQFHSVLPSCRLVVIQPIKFGCGKNGVYLVEKFAEEIWEDHVWHLTTFSQNITRFYDHYNAQIRVDFDNPFATPPTPALSEIHEIVMDGKATNAILLRSILCNSGILFSAMKNVHTLVIKDLVAPPDARLPLQYLPSLTHLDLGRAHVRFEFSELPPNIVHVSSLLTAKSFSQWTTRPNPYPKLKVLDVPNYSAHAVDIALIDFKSLDKMRIRLICMPDYNVIPFLTTAVGPRLRGNMSVRLEVIATGSLLKDGSELLDGLEELSEEQLCRLTETQLRAELGRPFMDESAKRGYGTDDGNGGSLQVVTSIGDVVEHLEIHGRCPLISVSSTSIKKISFKSSSPYKLIPNLMHLPAHPSTGLRSTEPFQFSSLSSLNWAYERNMFLEANFYIPLFPVLSHCSTLTHLELLQVDDFRTFWHSLPNSLTFMSVSSHRSMLPICDSFPPALETLILETKESGVASAGYLAFRMDALPSTLRYLTILSEPFVLRDHQEEVSKVLNLPHLKTAYFRSPTEVTVLALRQILPVDTMETFKVEKIAPTWGTSKTIVPATHEDSTAILSHFGLISASEALDRIKSDSKIITIE